MEDDTEKAESDKAKEEPTRVVPISTVRPITRPNLEGIATDEQLESTTKKLVSASKVVREDHDEPIRVPYIINGKTHYLTNDEINAHIEKEDKIKKATKKAKMFAKTKTEVIKVVQEEAEKIELDSKTIVSAQAGKKLKTEPITDVRINPNSKPAILIVFRNNDKRNFQVPRPFKFYDFGVTELDELGPNFPKEKEQNFQRPDDILGKEV
ncbi:hypothetical protein Tco_1391534 [Tanacetum coccineum]